MIAKQTTMITAVLAAGVLAAASSATQVSQQPTASLRSAVHDADGSKPVLAAVVTPNSLFAAVGAPQILVLGPGGSLAVGSAGEAAPVPITPTGDNSATQPAGVHVAVSGPGSPALRLMASTIQARSATPTGGRPAGSVPLAFTSSTTGGPVGLAAVNPSDAIGNLIGGVIGVFIGNGGPGQNAGLLIGNGGDGLAGQNGGRGGLLFGNGGNGGVGLAGHDAGN